MPTPELVRSVLDFINKMQHKHAKQVLLKIILLCQDPEPPDSIALHGRLSGFRRADAREYRIIYRVEGDKLHVPAIGKRNDDEVYRQLIRKL